jgi:hypothetical protein
MEDRDRRCSFFLRHDSHLPVGPGVPPQTHLRCKRPLRIGSGVRAGTGEVRAPVWSVAFIGKDREKRRWLPGSQ